MKFQFSIARLLMATAMVALTFGLARLMLDKEISTYVVLITVLAADLGLLVLVAQKKSDLYRILRIMVVVLCCILSISAIGFIMDSRSSSHSPGLMVLLLILILLSIGVLWILLVILLNKLIMKAEAKELERDRERGNDLTDPKVP